MSTSVSSLSTNFFPSGQNGFSTTLASTISSGATTVPLNSVAGYSNGEIAVFVVDPTDVTKKQTFTGIIDTSGVQVTSVVWTAGTNQSHSGGSTVVDYATATHISMMSKGILTHADQDGTLKAGAVDNAGVLASNVVTTAKILDANVTSAKVAGVDKSLLTTDSNPYKFSVYKSSAGNMSNGSYAKIPLAAETFDTNNNFDSVTNNRYTAPVAGFYFLHGKIEALCLNATWIQSALYKNGSIVISGLRISNNTGGNFTQGTEVSAILSLAASDYIELFGQANATPAMTTTADATFLEGYLISRT